MNLNKVFAALEQAARESDPEAADRLVLAFVSQTSGIYLFRPGHKYAVLGASDRSFGDEIRELVDQLWPDAPPKAKQFVSILAHAAGKRGLMRMLGVVEDD